MTSIRDNLRAVQQAIAAAAKGRPVRLVAVTKTASVSQMKEVLSLGVDCIGESRVKEAAQKFGQLSEFSFEKHMIGHLQTNKVREAVRLFDVIQSVDSFRLAKEIEKQATILGKTIRVFIEVNIAGEEEKYGISPDDASDFYKKLIEFPRLKAEGLMAMAPLIPAEEARPYFRRMRQLFEKLPLRWLSMGMSNDYVVAVEEGSNMVRIGSALFE